MLKKEQRKALMLSSLGGMLEFYDFIIYALLASYIGKLFFPATSTINSLLIAFSVYAVGYFARPFGGIIFGHFGDKFGRKKTFTISILVMASSTFLIGCLPIYQTIGMLAPVLLVMCRAAQGFSIGGEIPGAITYISEVAPHRKSLMTGTIFCFLISGVALGFIVEALLLQFFSHQQVFNWAWRIPFIIGGLFGFIAYYLRRQLVEIKDFQPFIKKTFSMPLTKVIFTHTWNLIYSIIIVSFGALCFVTLFLLLPVYFNSILQFHIAGFAWISCVGVILTALACIAVGYFSDKLNKNLILACHCLCTLIGSFAVYHIYTTSQNIYFVGIVISVIIAGLAWGNIPAMLVDLFRQDVRYTGIGFAYNVGFGVFGGLAPMLILSSIKISGNHMAPAYVLSIGAIITLVVMLLNHWIVKYRHSHKSISHI